MESKMVEQRIQLPGYSKKLHRKHVLAHLVYRYNRFKELGETTEAKKLWEIIERQRKEVAKTSA